jgi:hypothetical protein
MNLFPPLSAKGELKLTWMHVELGADGSVRVDPLSCMAGASAHRQRHSANRQLISAAVPSPGVEVAYVPNRSVI